MFISYLSPVAFTWPFLLQQILDLPINEASHIVFITHFSSITPMSPLTILLLSIAIAAVARPVDGARAFFVFGDSLVDGGNNNFLITSATANNPPHGIDYPTHRPTGRFSNGYILPDLISMLHHLKRLFVLGTLHYMITNRTLMSGQELGAESTLAYLDPALQGNRLLVGANFASAGIGILNDTGFQFVSSMFARAYKKHLLFYLACKCKQDSLSNGHQLIKTLAAASNKNDRATGLLRTVPASRY